MGVNDVDSVHSDVPPLLGVPGRVAMPWWMISRIRSRSAPTSGNRGARTHSWPRPHSWTASLMYWTNFVLVSKCSNGVNHR